MRVNLSYTVALQDVLAELEVLYKREKAKFDISTHNALKLLQERYTDENLKEVYTSLELCKNALLNFDIKLGEIQQIIKGYHEIINNPPKPPEEDTETDPAEADEDDVE